MYLTLQIAAGVLAALLLWTGLIQGWKDRKTSFVVYFCFMATFGLMALIFLAPAP